MGAREKADGSGWIRFAEVCLLLAMPSLGMAGVKTSPQTLRLSPNPLINRGPSRLRSSWKRSYLYCAFEHSASIRVKRQATASSEK